MNNFKKFVAVLLGVVMACVFATSAFAADFSNADTAAKAKAEIKAFAASYGITTIDNTDSSKIVVTAEVIANNARDTGSVVAEVPTTTTDNNTNTSAAVSNAAKNSAAASSVKTVSSAANPITASSSAVIKATGDNTAVVFAVAALAVAGVLGMAVRKERAL